MRKPNTAKLQQNELKSQMLQQASVILDLKDSRVVKNSIQKNYDFLEVLAIYRNAIGPQLDPYIEHLELVFEQEPAVVEAVTVEA